MSVSVVAVTDLGSRFASHTAMAEVAAELKKRAKATEGSTYLRDHGADTERRSEAAGTRGPI